MNKNWKRKKWMVCIPEANIHMSSYDSKEKAEESVRSLGVNYAALYECTLVKVENTPKEKNGETNT